ncbi:MAG: glycosyltransferase [Kiritimatiellia bacterium]
MRVIQVIGSLHPRMGGLPKSAVSIAATLAGRGVESGMVFFASPREMDQVRKAYGHFPNFDQVQLLPLRPGPLRSFRAAELRDQLERFSPDLLHTHGLWEPLLAHAQCHALRNRIPYVVMPHSMLHPWSARRYPLIKWGLKHGLGWKSRWRRAAAVQALTSAEASHWRAEGIDRIRIIPNGIFETEDPGESGKGREKLPTQPFVLSLARLHAQKAPDLLLRAFARLSGELHLVFAGPDYGMEKTLRRLAERLGCAERVHFPGRLEEAEKWTALHACRCFCLSSWAEGFSKAVLEAALAGAPIVISPECGFSELADAGGALIPELTPEALAGAMGRMMEEGPERGRAARAYVRSHCLWEQVADSLIGMYGELVA